MFSRLFVVSLCLVGCASQLGAQSSSNVYVFPVFAVGSAAGTTYRATVKINETGTATKVQCALVQRNTSASLTRLDGQVYTADVLDAGFSPAAQTTIFLEQYPFEILRTNDPSPLKTGYAKLSCPAAVQSQVQVSLFDAQNNKLGEATVPPATAGASFQFLIDRRDGTRMGFSLVNDSTGFEQFTLIARDQFNNVIDQKFDNIEPTSQVSRFVDEMLTLPANFYGSVEIVAFGGQQNYAVGLQYTGTVFTTIQPLVRSTPLPN
jgi:hypothetical protein